MNDTGVRRCAHTHVCVYKARLSLNFLTTPQGTMK